MFIEYLWILIIGIILLMIFYPTEKKYIKKKNKKKVSFSLKPIIHNIPTITSYYIGMN